MKTSRSFSTALLLAAFSFLFTFTVNAQWDSVGVPCRPTITNLQVAQGDVYATTGGYKVYKSADNGANWSFAFVARQFAINPANQRFYRLSQDFTRIECSLDNGANWLNVGDNPLGNNGFVRFDFSGDQVFVYTYGSVFRLDGSAWTPLPVPQDFDLAGFLTVGSNIWVNGSYHLIHTTDFGAHWDTVLTLVSPNYNLRMAGNSQTLLLNYYDQTQSQEVFLRSTDQGQNWTPYTGPGEIWTYGKQAMFLFQNRQTEQAYYSFSGDSNWQAFDTWSAPQAVASTNGVLIAGLSFGIQYQQNGVWKSPTFGVGVPNEMGYGIHITKTDNHLLVGNEYGYGMSKLATGASAWTRSDAPYFPLDPVQMGNYLVGAGKYGTYRTLLNASNAEWEKISNQGGVLFHENGVLYVYNKVSQQIFRSNDAGFSWVATGSINVLEDNELILLDGYFFAVQGNQIMISEDEGQTWSAIYNFSGQFSSRMYALNHKIILSHAIEQEVYISEDYGQTFQLSPAPQNNSFQGVYRLRLRGDVLFLYTGTDKFYQSIDEGLSWQKLDGPYEGFNFDPVVAENSFTVVDGRVYYFDDTLGVLWGAELGNTLAPPCESVVISMPPAHCTSQIDVSVENFTPEMVFKWYRNGNLIQQGANYTPSFMGQVGSTYVLVVSSPAFGCSISDTTVIVPQPVAQIGHPSILSCDLEFAELDLSGCSKTPGTIHDIYGYSDENEYFNYSNLFDASGNPTNPGPVFVKPGNYNLWVTDQLSGCSATATATIARDPNQTIEDLYIKPADCGGANGLAIISSQGGLPVDYTWSNGVVDSFITDLAPGWYSVTVTNGFCVTRRNFEVIESPDCQVRIKGTVMNDGIAPDCVLAFGTLYVANALVHLLPDDIYTFTDQIGNYEFARPPGDYTVELVDQGQYNLLCPTSGNFQVSLPNYGMVSSGKNFFVVPKPVDNLSIIVTSGPAVPGFQQKFYATLCNYGNEAVSDISVVFTHDALLGENYPSQYFSSYDPQSYTAISNGFNLQPQQCTSMEFTLQIPASVPLGSVLQYYMRIYPDDDDVSRADNVQEWQSTVVGSYDPNDKQVSPGESEFGGKIFERDTLLRYTIRFQNTGTYPATTVEIRDTLDEDLDITSFQLGGSSHSSNLRMLMDGNRILIFRFENINLPDSTTSFDYSQGYVSFSIKRKPGFVPGTEIRNRAAIYFDFNQPVITNEVVSVLSLPLGLRPEPTWEAVIFPNPNNGVFVAQLPEPARLGTTLRVLNSTGQFLREIEVEAGATQLPLRMAEVPPGLYLLQFLQEGQVLGTAKCLKQ